MVMGMVGLCVGGVMCCRCGYMSLRAGIQSVGRRGIGVCVSTYMCP